MIEVRLASAANDITMLPTVLPTRPGWCWKVQNVCGRMRGPSRALEARSARPRKLSDEVVAERDADTLRQRLAVVQNDP